MLPTSYIGGGSSANMGVETSSSDNRSDSYGCSPDSNSMMQQPAILLNFQFNPSVSNVSYLNSYPSNINNYNSLTDSTYTDSRYNYDINSRHYHNQHPYISHGRNSKKNESSFLFLKDDELHNHYTNFLSPQEKETILMSMLSEMAFWEFPKFRSNSWMTAKARGETAHMGNSSTVKIQATDENRRQNESHMINTYNDSSSFKAQVANSSVYNYNNSNNTIMNETRDASRTESIPGHSGRNDGYRTSSNHNNNISNEKISSSSVSKQPLRRSSSGAKASKHARTEEEEEMLNRELDELDLSKISWRHAVDPATGRVYYYDSVTRKTQWEKPREIRMMEKKKKRDQRRADIAFFRAMEKNLLASLARGEKIPCVSPDLLNKEGPPNEPSPPSPADHHTASSSSGKVTRVRTISGMDQHVLAQLGGGFPSSLAQSSETATLKSKPKPVSIRVSNNNTGVSRSGSNEPSAATSSAIPPLLEGRPPLAQRRTSSSGPANNNNGPSNQQQQQAPQTLQLAPTSANVAAQKGYSQPPQLYSVESLELSPDTADFGKTSDSELRGVDLLTDDGSLDDDDNTKLSNSSTSKQLQEQKPGSSDIASTKSPTANHVRRNTGNTMFFDTTMDNPNIDATMQCVCGVYRAHIVHFVDRGNFVQYPALEVFRDDYEQLHSNKQRAHPLNPNQRPQQREPSNQQSQRQPHVPSLSEIKAFYHEFYQRSQMEHDTIIMSLIYVERLMKETNGALAPNPYNWRSVLFSCMILASKVWDDLSMWNIDFSNVSVAASSTSNNHNLLSAFSLQRINQLELAVLTNLSFRTAIPASEYAKYYFLIRTMLMRSGLLNGPNNVKTPEGPYRTPQQEREAADRLENRTSQYQNTINSSQHLKNRGGNRRAIARSVDWSCLESRGGSAPQELISSNTSKSNGTDPEATSDTLHDQTLPIGPVLHDTVCLEQIVSN